MDNPRRSNRGVEENTLAILDSSGIRNDRDVHDDRLSFLEAVRSASLISDSSSVPTRKMFNAVFRILRDATSLEEAMASYQLLVELEKRYPRSYLADQQKSGFSHAGGNELVVVKEAWSPFISGLETAHAEGEGAPGSKRELLDASGFFLLTHDIAEAASGVDFQLTIKLVKDMLLFQYLVDVLKGDFMPRQTLYKVTMNWVLLRESLLSILLVLKLFLEPCDLLHFMNFLYFLSYCAQIQDSLLISSFHVCFFSLMMKFYHNFKGSRKVSFRNLVRDCMAIIPGRFCHRAGSHLHDLKSAKHCLTQTANDCNAVSVMAMVELEKKTCSAVEKLLILVMELDVHKKVADIQGHTSRADTVRIPLLEIIIDELTYNKDSISPFFEAFSDTKWKLELVLQYFWKYCNKSSVRTRKSNDSFDDDATFEAVLKNFSSVASTRSLVRKMTAEVAQLLLAHAFQAYLSLRHCLRLVVNKEETSGGNPLLQISKDLISAFENIKRNNEDMDIQPFEKEALFTATTIAALEFQAMRDD